MYVVHKQSGKRLKATIIKIDAQEISLVNKSKRFDFNWNKEKKCDVYKLMAKGVDLPLGLVSLQERSADMAIEIRLLAMAKENIGQQKQYERIAGCLIAFACKRSFEIGYDGYVCLKSKTKLVHHYITKYRLVPTQLFLVTYGRNSNVLIDEYYED